MHAADNVAIIANDGGLPAGTVLPSGLRLAEQVPQAHKVALVDIAQGAAVRRYNVVIGYARQAYNDQVLEFNNASRAFPAIVVASILGFHAMPMLQSTQTAQEREAVRVQF